MIASRTGIPLLAALGAGIALGAASQRALRPPARHAVEITTSLQTLPLHRTPVLRTAHRDCTRPLETIGKFGTGSLRPYAPERIAGIAASATGCTIAVWNSDGAYVSRDDGASWTHMLSASLGAHNVAVAAAENVYLLASATELAVAHPDGTSAIHRPPFGDIDRIATSGDWVIVASPRELAISRDEGATWERRPTPAVLTSTAWFVDADGAIRLAVGGAQPDDPISLWTSTPTGWRLRWTSPAHVPLRDQSYPDGRDGQTASVSAYAFAHDGTLVAERWDRREHRFFVVDALGNANTVDHPPATLDFAGVTITGTHGDLGARDAHGKLLVLSNRRGPIRLDGHTDTMLIGPFGITGRWITGDLQVD